jgi:hypothetical protein
LGGFSGCATLDADDLGSLIETARQLYALYLQARADYDALRSDDGPNNADAIQEALERINGYWAQYQELLDRIRGIGGAAATPEALASDAYGLDWGPMQPVE